MKKIITIILLLVALAVLIYQQTNNTIKQELRDFAVEDISTITKVFLADRHGHDVTLFKTDDKWLVENKYPARKDGIEIMLSTMNKVRVRQPVSESMHNNVIKNLAASSVKVEIFTDNTDEAEKTYYVGGEVADLLGSFMMMENSSKAFITHIPGFNGFLAPRYSIEGTRVSMDLWRDRSILNMDAADIEFVSVEHHENETAEGNLYLDKVNGNFVLFENGEGSLANQERVNTYLQLWGKANCEGFMNDFSKKDSIINSAPFHTIKVWNKDGEEKTIRTYHKAPKRAEYQDLNGQPLKWDVDRMYAYDGTDFTLIQFYTFNKLLLSPNDLR
tara:strand:+ start:243 stop:1235 length:993 start_codon:yes stop_codon:yes gene_type:complete